MTSQTTPNVREEAVRRIAARLANTGRVLRAWSRAMQDGQEVLQRRLLRAVSELDQVVGALTIGEEEFLRLEDDDRLEGVGLAAVNELGGGVVAETEDDALGLRGRSEMISLVEMVAFLSSLGRDGVLQAQTDQQEYILELTGGRLTYAALTPKRPGMGLGEILRERGSIDADDLERGLQEARGDEFLGEALLRQGLVERGPLLAALGEQALRIFRRMHSVGTGFNFQFQENTQILFHKDIRLGVSGLLLESARLIDEEEHKGVLEAALADVLEEQVREEREDTPSEEPTCEEPTREEPTREEPTREEPTTEEPTTEEPTTEEPPPQLESRSEPRWNLLSPGSGQPKAASEEAVDAALRTVRDLTAFREALRALLTAEKLELPVLPDATGRLLALCWTEDLDTEELMACVNRDQALSAHILRIANSAAYAPATPISSVQIAIARLGLDKLREIAMALTLKQAVFRLSDWEDVIQSLWRRAAVTSGFGGAVGKASSAGGVRGGMVGLLLDVGKPVILSALHDLQRELQIELTPEIAETLMEELHGEIGELMAKAWQLPDWLTGVMRHHHHYSTAQEHRMEAMVGNFAYHLALWAESPEGADAATLSALPVCQDLGIPEMEVERILEQRERILALAQVYS